MKKTAKKPKKTSIRKDQNDPRAVLERVLTEFSETPTKESLSKALTEIQQESEKAEVERIKETFHRITREIESQVKNLREYRKVINNVKTRITKLSDLRDRALVGEVNSENISREIREILHY